ncbi:Rib/alpha-like domain-containing protein, partial [Streptococcus sp.]
MENKSNSLNRIKRHQREKVLRFSIRKYSFGAASVAVASLMFLGARVVSADTVSGSSSQSTAGVVQPNDKGDSPVGIKEPTENKSEVVNSSLENKETALVENGSNTVDKSQLRTVVEELNSLLSTKLNLDDSVLSSVKERVQRAQALLDKADAVQKDINELKELLSADLATLSNAVKESSEVRESNTGTEAEKPASQPSSEVRASEENQTVSAKKDSLKVSVDQLQAAISEVPEHDTTKEVLKKANEVMVLAQGVLQNTTVSLTDVEQMNKLVKRMFISVKNATTRLSSGSHDPRNGKRIAKGTGFRADVGRVEGALNNVKEYISEDKFSGGGTSDGQRARTIDKTFMTAKYSTEGNKKFITYDVYFQNDGMALSGQTGNAFWFYPPRDILYNSGNYVRDTIVEAYYERYRKNAGATGRLSDNPNNFTKLDTYNAIEQLRRNGTNQDDSSRRQWGDRISLYQLDGGPTRDNQTQQMLKSLQNNEELNRIIRLNNNPRGSYPGLSYSQILTISGGQNYAYKYHVKMRLKDDVTPGQAQNAGTIAVTAKEGKAYNALQAYVYAATGTRLESRPDAQLYPIKGKEVTKTVGESIENVSNPVASGFVVRNDDTKNFPDNMNWNWTNGQPNTSTAGIFKYNVTATYSDKSSNPAIATLKVKPKTPVIDQSSVNEKAGETGQNVVVTVQDGVPDGSTVTLYNGTAVIGRGRTIGRTATINVSGALPSTAITAKTTVTNNYGTVESELSAPVTPTEVPDRTAPTVLINGKALTGNADDNRFIIYRGANFNPTFRVQDDKSNNVNLSITGLPNGVANVTTSGGKEFNYTIPDNTVANEAPFGESTATVTATDGRNSATYRFKYRIVDIQAKNSTTENRALGSALGDPHNHFKVAESNTVENDKYYPTGMQFKWIELNRSTITTTDVPNTTNLNELGNVTKYFATAVFPAVKNTKEIDRVNYTIYSPKQKAIPITFNVTDNVKPTVKLVGDNGSDTTLSESTPEANLPKVTVYRGEKANVTIKASDNTGKIKELRGSGMPNGIWFNKNPNANSEVWLSSDNATETNPLSHTITGVVEKGNRIEEKTVTINASDKTEPSNVTTVKFKMVVKEQKDKYTPTAGTTPVAVNNIGSISTSDLDKIKNSVSVPNLSPEATRDGGVRTSLKNNGAVTTNNGKKYVTVEVTYPDGSKDEVPVEVQQNTNVVKRPIINLKQGETLSAEEMKTIVELQDGTSKLPLPADAVVTATFDTNTVRDGNWTDITVRFNDGPSKTVRANYNVKATFPVANTVYDFRGVTRTNDSESNYYINRNLPTGMSWFVKKGTENKSDARIHTYLATDDLGKTDYTFGAYYRAGRFNDNESNVDLKLKHEGTISHHVYDVMAATNKITVNNGATLTEANAKAAVTKVAGSEDLPTGTTYEWVDANGNKITPTASTAGVQTFKVKVTLPPAQSGNDAPEATKRQPSKIIDVPVNVAPSAPTITTETRYNGTLVSTDRRISGTGIAGATITVALQDGKTGTTTVDNNGRWTYTLKENEKLTQNTKQDASIKAPNAISVTQTKDGVESPASRVDVQLAKAISIDTPVQAGRELAVKVAHDTGLFYLQVLNGNQTVYEYAVKQQNGNWVLERGSDTTDLTVSNGDNVSEKKITLRIKDSHKKTNFPFKITGDNVVRVRAHHVNRNNNPADPTNDGGWVVAAKATNTNPTITINNPRATYVADGTLTKDKLKTLVTVTDTEDDADKTVGPRAKDNLDVTATKDGKNVDLAQPLKQGTYNLTYRTTDAAGATVTKEHTITVNYTAVAKPTINLLQGETVSDELKRSLLQLQDGTSKIDVPNNAIVEVTLDTSTPSNTNKTASATVVFADNTRTTPVTINYKVLPTFPVATRVYDFAGVARNQNEGAYYTNPGNLPQGFDWFVKQNGTAKPDGYIQNYLRNDPVGTTSYVFGAKYREGRFSNNASGNDRLEHSGTVSHTVFDVGANTTRVMVKSGTALADSQAKDAVMAVNGSAALPSDTTYEWVNQDGTPLANKTVTEKGEATRYVKVTLPKTAVDGPAATQYQSYKIVEVKINESEKPKVSFNGSELSKDASNENSKFVIFRGATFNPTFTVSDNSGKVTEVKASGLPSGREFVKNTDTPNGDVQLTGAQITDTSNAALGDHIGKVLVKDASGNEQEYQFKYTVVDVEAKNTPETVTLGTKLVDTANSRNGKDAHDYVKAVVESNSTGNDKYYPTNMSFKWSKDGNFIENTTTFDTPGIVKYNAVADFDGAGGVYTKTVEGIGNNIKIYAPDKIEREVAFLVKPAPTVETKEVPSPVRYEGDTSRDKDSDPVRTEGTPGEDTITTT